MIYSPLPIMFFPLVVHFIFAVVNTNAKTGVLRENVVAKETRPKLRRKKPIENGPVRKS